MIFLQWYLVVGLAHFVYALFHAETYQLARQEGPATWPILFVICLVIWPSYWVGLIRGERW